MGINMKIEPLWNERALIADKTLAVADIHIGYEQELREKGVNIPSQTKRMIDEIVELLKENDIDKLVIVGDLKHNIPQGSWQEYKEIPKAIDEWLKEVEEIHLLPGNHDGGIERYLPQEVFIHESSGETIDGVGYFHGHAIPSPDVLESEMIVVAHNHPSIAITDSLDRRQKKHCWIRLEFEYETEDRAIDGSAILMPNYNPLLGGVCVNEKGYLGTFLKNSRFKQQEIYLLNGAYLGDLEDWQMDEFS